MGFCFIGHRQIGGENELLFVMQPFLQYLSPELSFTLKQTIHLPTPSQLPYVPQSITYTLSLTCHNLLAQQVMTINLSIAPVMAL